ncbi:MAG: hypothetical protein AAF806_07690 [Bacteroidota bacterium]
MSINKALFLQALQNALRGSTNTLRDPAKNVYYDETNVLDHENIFRFLDQDNFRQGTINRDNILNAATLYGVMMVGDEMGVFRTADVILKYVTLGRIDVASSTTATRIYNYMKLRDERTTMQERYMFYKQVFDMGEEQSMKNMAHNKGFGQLWDTLMYEVVRYIRKFERADVPENVSKSSIIQVMLDLQHNLSRAASGMVKIFVPEMYAHMEDAIKIIDAPEIKDQIGHGVARDLWNIIESVSQEEFGYYPNTSALRTIAANARQVMLVLADFVPATFSNEDFQDFVRTVEAYIVAKSQIENNGRSYLENNGYEEESYMDDDDRFEPELETMDEDWDF